MGERELFFECVILNKMAVPRDTCRAALLFRPAPGANDEFFQTAVAAGVLWVWGLLPGTNGRTICNNNILFWDKSGRRQEY
jgi:hypothetical protein